MKNVHVKTTFLVIPNKKYLYGFDQLFVLLFKKLI